MAINVGIADLVIRIDESEDDEDLEGARELYRRLSALVQSAGHVWSEPESLADDGWDGHLDQMGTQAYSQLVRVAENTIGSHSHLVAAQAPSFLVPFDFAEPLPVPAGTALPGRAVGSVQAVLRELDLLRGSLGIRRAPVRVDTPVDDIQTVWNVLYFTALDSVAYGSAVRLG